MARLNWLAVLMAVASFITDPTVARAQWSTLYGAAREESRRISSSSLAKPLTSAQWQATAKQRLEMWREMLGLSPLPQRTPIHATVTGILDRGDYVVEKIHFQSIPGAYVFANIYRPAKTNGKLPAVLYLCGHSKGKGDDRYQANARWFGQHGYVAMILDPIQLGESQGMHHGTYRHDRWDWPSRGYTPAGTEVWNAMRALDYLQSRPDVDGNRLGVTGNSGGGAMSWFLGAADDRVKCVVPVCQSGSIQHVVTDRATDGHCDCTFWINYYRWCWPDIGALIAPRSFMIAASSDDILWRPYGYRETAHRIRQQYAALDAIHNFDLVEDLAPHGYTPKLRRAIFTWFNTHLKNDPTPVTDDVTDFVEPEAELLVLGGKHPQNDEMRRIDKLLVHRPDLPKLTDEVSWRAYENSALRRLRDITFRTTVSQSAPRMREFRDDGRDNNGKSSTYEFETFDGLTLCMRVKRPTDAQQSTTILAFAVQPDAQRTFNGGGSSRPNVSGITTAAVEVRNTGSTSVGPGYLHTVRRTYPLLGQTLPERQVSDLLCAIKLMRAETGADKIAVFGRGPTAPLAIYAALLDPTISEIVLSDCPATHEDPKTPEFLGVLRVGDLPHNLALAYPRPITFVGRMPDAFMWTKQLYEKLGAGDRIRSISTVQSWQPK